MPERRLRTVARFNTSVRWPDGCVGARREAGAHEKTMPWCLGWVGRFFAENPDRRRRDLGRGESERFVGLVVTRQGVREWRVQQAPDAIEGDQDRRVPLPAKIEGSLREWLRRPRELYGTDKSANMDEVEVPAALAREYPNTAGATVVVCVCPVHAILPRKGICMWVSSPEPKLNTSRDDFRTRRPSGELKTMLGGARRLGQAFFAAVFGDARLDWAGVTDPRGRTHSSEVEFAVRKVCEWNRQYG